MEQRNITRKERSCISNCIFRFWGDRENPITPEQREPEYEQCLTDCRVCG